MAKLPKTLKPAPGYVLMLQTEPDKNEALTVEVQVKNCCKVIAVGAPIAGEFNGKIIKPPCKPKDIVYHTTTGYEDININNVIYRIIKFQNILGVL